MYPIPANATRIRYLESTGTQYIDTGYILNTASKIEVSGKWTYRTTGNNDAQQMGVIKGADSGQYRTVFANQGGFFSLFSANVNPYVSNSGLPEVTYYVDFPSLVAKVNTAQAAISSSSLTGTFTRPFYLFARCESGTTPGLFCKFQLKSAKFWTNGVLVRDFQPVRVGQVGYLFDRVSGQLFGNAGTGDFVLGPDTFAQGVVPTRMMVAGVRKKSITFIRATGTCYPTAEKTNNCSYINTAINPDAQTIVEIVCRVKPGSAIQAWPYLLGAQTANDNANTFSVRGQANNTSYAPWTNYRWGHSAWQSFGISETWGGSSTWHTINVSRYGIVLDGIQYTATGTTNTNLPNKPIFIGCINRNGSPQNCILLDVASLKIWNGTTLQFDGTPQVVNGFAGLKDSVSGSLFSSSSSSNPYQLLQEPAS